MQLPIPYRLSPPMQPPMMEGMGMMTGGMMPMTPNRSVGVHSISDYGNNPTPGGNAVMGDMNMSMGSPNFGPMPGGPGNSIAVNPPPPPPPPSMGMMGGPMGQVQVVNASANGSLPTLMPSASLSQMVQQLLNGNITLSPLQNGTASNLTLPLNNSTNLSAGSMGRAMAPPQSAPGVFLQQQAATNNGANGGSGGFLLTL